MLEFQSEVSTEQKHIKQIRSVISSPLKWQQLMEKKNGAIKHGPTENLLKMMPLSGLSELESWS